MNRNFFFNLFPNEDEFLIASLWDDLMLCLEIEFPIYGSSFVSPHIWTKLSEVSNQLGVGVFTVGLTPISEKKIIAFAPKNFLETDLEFPIKFFKIIGTNKFKTLQHKDFLGSIMSLGLKRESLGDILVKDNIGYCIAFQDIYTIIKNNLQQINTIPIKISDIDLTEIPELQFKEISDTVSSFRLDSIIAAIANISRNVSVDLIESGDILVNYLPEKNKSKIININSIITVKKKGKFILYKNLGETKKGKFKIIIKQYI